MANGDDGSWSPEAIQKLMSGEPTDHPVQLPGAIAPTLSKDVVNQQILTDSPLLRGAAIGLNQIGVGLAEDAIAPVRWGAQLSNALTGTNDMPRWTDPSIVGHALTYSGLRPITPEERLVATTLRGAGEGSIFGPRGVIAGATAGGLTDIEQSAGMPAPVPTGTGAAAGGAVAGGELLAMKAAHFLFGHLPFIHAAAHILKAAVPNVATGLGIGAMAGSTMGDLDPNYAYQTAMPEIAKPVPPILTGNQQVSMPLAPRPLNQPSTGLLPGQSPPITGPAGYGTVPPRNQLMQQP